MKKTKKIVEEKELKIDLGCGPHKREGFVGIDSMKFDGVDIVADLTKKWPLKDNSVSEIHASHFVEHLTADQRVHFCNEAWRVMKTGSKATIICPHWASCRAYGDMTHQWPPVSEFWFYYLSRDWRKGNAPHNDKYKCNFTATWGYSLRQDLLNRNQEFQMNAISTQKEAAQDIIATITKEL